jgi:site-specific recombinase XerD
MSGPHRVAEAFPEFVAWLEQSRRCTHETARGRDADIRRFLAHVRRSNPDKVSRNMVTRYLTASADRWSANYRKRTRASLELFFRWTTSTGLTATNIAENLPQIRVQAAIPHPTPDTVVLQAFKSSTPAEQAMIALAGSMGMRRTEIATAHPRNRRGRNLTVHGKGDKARTIRLNDMCLRLLTQIESEQGADCFYFPGGTSGHLHPSTVYKWVKRNLGPDWTLHSLRHRAATTALHRTHDIRAVQAFLGHASLGTTQIYTAVTEQDLDAIAEATEWLPPLKPTHAEHTRPGGRFITLDLDHVSLKQVQMLLAAATTANS